MQLTYGMYATMGLEGAIGNATASNASVVRVTAAQLLSSQTLLAEEGRVEHE